MLVPLSLAAVDSTLAPNHCPAIVTGPPLNEHHAPNQCPAIVTGPPLNEHHALNDYLAPLGRACLRARP